MDVTSEKLKKPTTAEGAVSEPMVTDYHSGTGNETNQGGASWSDLLVTNIYMFLSIIK